MEVAMPGQCPKHVARLLHTQTHPDHSLPKEFSHTSRSQVMTFAGHFSLSKAR